MVPFVEVSVESLHGPPPLNQPALNGVAAVLKFGKKLDLLGTERDDDR